MMPRLYRTPEDSGRFFPLMLLAHVLMAVALTWIYAQGRETAQAMARCARAMRFGIRRDRAAHLRADLRHLLRGAADTGRWR
ncbi:MAG: hypothetical protein U1F67_20875 [Rubrivivax sp.]